MGFSIIEKAIPFFFGLILLEAVISFFSKKKVYNLRDSVVNLATTIIFSATGLFVIAAALWVYHKVQQHFSIQALWSAPAIPWSSPLVINNYDWSIDTVSLVSWVLVLIIVDFIYYWFHRACHEVNFLWACHVTHHSSEEFNLTVALRQCSFQRIFEYLFYLPLAVAGVSWQMFFLCHGILKIYQFWVHTRYIGNLGLFEKFMLTPSHHRIHHASDKEYLDKNHGGIFVIWDRMFGSFAEESHEPRYGLTKNLKTSNAFQANVHHYLKIIKDLVHVRGFINRLKILFFRPGWSPGDSYRSEPVIYIEEKYQPETGRAVSIYIFLQFIIVLVMALAYLKMAKRPDASLLFKVLAASVLVFSLSIIPALFDQRRYSFFLEMGRLFLFCLLAIGASFSFALNPAIIIPVLVFYLFSMLFFYTQRDQFN